MIIAGFYTGLQNHCTQGIQDKYYWGPRNIVRVEGEKNIYIPCPFSDGEYDVIWEINGSIYSSYTTPSWCTSYAFGLLIKNADRTLNNTSFRCLYSSGERGLDTISSSTGILTVIQ